MRHIGYSTGAIAKGDFIKALLILEKIDLTAVELSALREEEFLILYDLYDSLDLNKYQKITIHAPSKLHDLTEKQLVEMLSKFTAVVVHPDIITDYDLWNKLGDKLIIENMDKRKSIGQDVWSMNDIFKKLASCKFCLDLAHTKQVDESMMDCKTMAFRFQDRLAGIHVSDLNEDSKHICIDEKCAEKYIRLSHWFPKDMTIIIESPASDETEVAAEIEKVWKIFL